MLCLWLQHITRTRAQHVLALPLSRKERMLEL